MPDITYLAYVGEKGGDAVQAFELARGMAQTGANIKLIVPELPGLRAKATDYARQNPTLRVDCTPLIRYNTITQNPADVFRLIAPLRNTPILHIHSGDICPPRLSLMALDVLRPRALFATIHAAKPDMPIGGKRAAYWASVVRRRFHAVFCPSKHGREIQNQYGLPTDKTRAIYNGVDIAHYAGGNASVARAQLGLSPDVPLVLFLAGFRQQKRPLDALHAFARACEKIPTAHFALIGNGPLEEIVKQEASSLPCANRVHFVDHVTNVPDYLAACDVWFLPSEAENFCLGVLEALSAGCAVVATNCIGNDEVLVHDENALLANVGDVALLSEHLASVLSDAARRARLQTRAKQTATHYSLEAMTNHYQHAYQEFAGNRAL